MLETSENLSVLFADMAGSSRLYKLLGNTEARRLITNLLVKLSACALENQGGSLLTIGDELMCAFTSADYAVATAAAMHQIAAALPAVQKGDFGPIGLYIRIDTGKIIRAGNELFGDAVNTAAKMKSLAKPSQTLISKSTLSALSSEHQRLTRFIGNLPIKGITGTFDIFEYIADLEGVTQMIERPAEAPPSLDALHLTRGTTVLTVDKQHPSMAIGRLPDNDIVLKYPHVSRMHAKIELRRGKFMLVDTSVNGTYIHISDQDVVYLNHDEMQLQGKGMICPGKEAAADAPGVIHFAIR